MTGKNGVLNGQFSRSAQRNTNPDGGIKETWERKLEMRFRGKNKTRRRKITNREATET